MTTVKDLKVGDLVSFPSITEINQYEIIYRVIEIDNDKNEDWSWIGFEDINAEKNKRLYQRFPVVEKYEVKIYRPV